MPLPSPRSDEDEDAFISRCMGDEAMQEFDTVAQRVAVCHRQWDSRDEERGAAMTTATLTRKTHPIEIKAIDEVKGLVTAVVNSLDVVDHDDEVIASGAFDESLKRNLPSVAWFHDQTKIIGGVIAAREDKKRLIADMQFDLDTDVGSYGFKMVARGRVKEWSVGFYAQDWHMEDREGKAIRVLDSVELVEISAVLKGASPGTMTVDAKDRKETSAPAASDDAAGTERDPWTAGAKAAIARFRDDLVATGIIPAAKPEQKAGRTMSSRNLVQVHEAMDKMMAMHDAVCDMGDACPMADAPPAE